MKRESINPVEWGLKFSMDQGEVVEGATRHLRCSGQVSVEESAETELGFDVVAPGDLRGQIAQSLSNIDDVLSEAGMSRENIVNLRVFTTDIDGFLENYDVYAEWIAPAGTRPPQSLIGVSRLVLESLMVEIEVEGGCVAGQLRDSGMNEYCTCETHFFDRVIYRLARAVFARDGEEGIRTSLPDR